MVLTHTCLEIRELRFSFVSFVPLVTSPGVCGGYVQYHFKRIKDWVGSLYEEAALKGKLLPFDTSGDEARSNCLPVPPHSMNLNERSWNIRASLVHLILMI